MFNNKKKTKKILEYSPVESCRFGMNVYRGIVDQIDQRLILANIISEKVDIAILRLPADQQAQLSRFDEVGLPYIVADTLVYYDVDLTSNSIKELINKDLSFIECSAKHEKILDSLVDKIFKGYTNHYNSNPFLPNSDILEGYKEWARSFIIASNSGKKAWIVKCGENYIGFACCAYDDFKCTAVLYGILPEASGKGVYGDLIRFTQKYFKEKQYKLMEISTQIQNYASQKVWAREGAVLKKAYITVHVNSFMNYSATKKEVFNISIPDTAAINFSCNIDIASKNCIIDSSGYLEYGSKLLTIIDILVSNYYTAQYPGAKALIEVQKQIFISPVHVPMNYKLIISFPHVDISKGLYKSLVTLADEQGNLYYLSHNNLHLKRND